MAYVLPDEMRRGNPSFFLTKNKRGEDVYVFHFNGTLCAVHPACHLCQHENTLAICRSVYRVGSSDVGRYDKSLSPDKEGEIQRR